MALQIRKYTSSKTMIDVFICRGRLMPAVLACAARWPHGAQAGLLFVEPAGLCLTMVTEERLELFCS